MIERWILFLTILILVATVFPFLYYYLRRPKLHVKPHIEQETLANEENFLKLTFWILVRNSGRESAKCSQPMVKLTDSTRQIEAVRKLSYPAPGSIFPLDWLVAGKPKEQVEIPRTTKDVYLHQFRLPLSVVLATRKADVLGEKHLSVITIAFEEPINEWEVRATSFGDAEKGVHFELGIEVISPPVEKRFVVLSLPWTRESLYEPKNAVFKLKG